MREMEQVFQAFESSLHILTGRSSQGTFAPYPSRSSEVLSPVYVVQPGDTLSSIAARFNVSYSELYAANAHGSVNWNGELVPGQGLIVPHPSPGPLPASAFEPTGYPWYWQAQERQTQQSRAARKREEAELTAARAVQEEQRKREEEARSLQALEDDLLNPVSPYPELEHDLEQLERRQRLHSRKVAALRHEAPWFLVRGIATASSLIGGVTDILVFHNPLAAVVAGGLIGMNSVLNWFALHKIRSMT